MALPNSGNKNVSKSGNKKVSLEGKNEKCVCREDILWISNWNSKGTNQQNISAPARA